MDVEENSGEASVLIKEDGANNFNGHLGFIEMEVYDGQPV